MSRTERCLVGALVACAALAFFGFAFARFRTFHNETFDLAFYVRMAWGMVHGVAWEPIIGANLLGLHLSPILLPVGALGLLVGTAPALLGAQALSASLAALPLAQIGARRLGPGGGVVGALALLLHPNLGHVVTYEAHPGSLALLPLALLAEALDRADARRAAFATLLVLACREDLAAVTALAGACLFFDKRVASRWPGALLFLGSCLYLALFFLALHPRFKPLHGSMEAHFGQWGGTLGEVASTLLGQPGLLLEHFGVPARLSYLPRVLGSLLLLPLLAPRLLFVTAPILGVCLLSSFPTTTRIDSHYLTPALPLLVAAALVGAARLAAMVPALSPRRLEAALGLASLAAFLVAGGLPPARAFDSAYFTPGADQEALEVLVAAVPPGASFQGADRLLPHLAEREWVHRAPPPERLTDFVALDATHRLRYAERETLLRTSEEPFVRAFLAREDHALVGSAAGHILLERRATWHAERVAPYRDLASESAEAFEAAPVLLTRCLSVTGVTRVGADKLRLHLLANAPCASDLAVRIGGHARPRRVDLLFGGLLSPAHLRAGDRLVSEHVITVTGDTLHLGALRQSGPRPEPSDPSYVTLPIRPE